MTDRAFFEASIKVLHGAMTELHRQGMRRSGELEDMLLDTDEIVSNLFDDHRRTKERLTELEHAHAAVCARLDRLTDQ